LLAQPAFQDGAKAKKTAGNIPYSDRVVINAARRTSRAAFACSPLFHIEISSNKLHNKTSNMLTSVEF
jgi:hypothetical protein